MERGLVLRQHFFGAGSDEVWRACKTVGEMCNLLAMTYLQQEDLRWSWSCSKRRILTERDPAGRAVTFNNLACYYRRQGKLHAALQYLQKALKIEGRLESVDNPADTFERVCGSLATRRHQSALEHAQQALDARPGGRRPCSVVITRGLPKQMSSSIGYHAYHNVGVEQEFLKKHNQSLQSYRKGVEVAERYLGGGYAIASPLANPGVAARRTMLARTRKLDCSGHGEEGRLDERPASTRRKRGRGHDLRRG